MVTVLGDTRGHMARSKNRDSSSSNGQRDLSTPRSLDALLAFKPRPAPVLLHVPASEIGDLRPIEDRRTFTPDRHLTPPRSTRPGASRVVADPKSATTLKFADPAYVSLCERRSRRRQVLFAKRKTKKGSGSVKRRNFWSSISCSEK